MASDHESRLLDLIVAALEEHGSDLSGAITRHADSLEIFDARMRMRVKLDEPQISPQQCGIHAHVVASLPAYGDSDLDACLYGVGSDVEAALMQVAGIWLTGVAGAIKSFLDGKPACAAETVSPNDDFGLHGMLGYVGPCIVRGQMDDTNLSALGARPWFCFAASSASPQPVHIAKVYLSSKGEQGWSRDLEIDGHQVTWHDERWTPGVIAPPQLSVHVVRFAVFAYPPDSEEPKQRQQLAAAIRFFALNLERNGSDAVMRMMIENGFSASLTHEVESVSTLAFGRHYFSLRGVRHPPTVILARRSGQIEEVPVMSLPSFTRALALAPALQEELSADAFQDLCCYSAESGAILKSMEAGTKDLSSLKLIPCVVPELGVSDATFKAALALMHSKLESETPKQKPWWKIW